MVCYFGGMETFWNSIENNVGVQEKVRGVTRVEKAREKFSEEVPRCQGQEELNHMTEPRMFWAEGKVNSLKQNKAWRV